MIQFNDFNHPLEADVIRMQISYTIRKRESPFWPPSHSRLIHHIFCYSLILCGLATAYVMHNFAVSITQTIRRCLLQDLTADEIDEMFSLFDKDGNGGIDTSLLDNDGDGVIDAQEFANALDDDEDFQSMTDTEFVEDMNEATLTDMSDATPDDMSGVLQVTDTTDMSNVTGTLTVEDPIDFTEPNIFDGGLSLEDGEGLVRFLAYYGIGLGCALGIIGIMFGIFYACEKLGC